MRRRPLDWLTIVNVATALAILLAIAVAVHAIRLLIVGQAWTVVSEVPLSEATQEAPEVASVEHGPYPAAAVPLLAATVLLAGLLTRQMPLAWIGMMGLLVFSVLFLFSSGAMLLPVVGLLLILLSIITLPARKREAPDSTAKNVG